MFSYLDKLFSHHHNKVYKRIPTLPKNNTQDKVTINGVELSVEDALIILSSSTKNSEPEQVVTNNNPPWTENMAPPLPTLYEFRCLQCGNIHKTTYKPAAKQQICYTCKYPYRCHNCGKGMKTNQFRNCYDCNGKPTKKNYNVVKLH